MTDKSSGAIGRTRVVPIDNPSGKGYEIHERLLNWARWLEERQPRARAMSIEGNYEPEAGNTWEGMRFRVPIDVLDAHAVDAGVLMLHHDQRLAIGLRYWARIGDWSICRRVGLRPAEYGDFMAQAREDLGAYLLIQRNALIVAANNEKPIAKIERTLAATEGRAFPNAGRGSCQQQASGRVQFLVAARSSPAAAAPSIAKQTEPAAGNSSPAPTRTSAAPGASSGNRSSGPSRFAALVRPRGR